VIAGYVAVLGESSVTCVLAGRVVTKRVGWVGYLHRKVSKYRLAIRRWEKVEWRWVGRCLTLPTLYVGRGRR
jgi:hypothetical protein